MYKLLAIDMDGTLLNSKGNISEGNKEAIKRAIENGVKVVITSGRSIGGLNRFLEHVGLVGENEYIITNNGGSIYRTNDFKCISYKGLKGSDLMKAYKLSKELGVKISAYVEEGCIFPEDNEFVKFEREHIGTPVKIIDFDKDVNDNDEIAKILFLGKDNDFENYEEKIPREFFDNYHMVKSLSFVLEMMNKECNKGYGVRTLAEYLNIKIDEIICIGDQANDLEMIEYAGLGIAMGNAIDDIKNIASYVTDTNDNDGVAKAIYKFVLGSGCK
ncbi:hypothetical protein SAMN02745163_03169 [Clostridium cavendishii DSM 21758]|uniref:Haloacid dehalogenase-like hydrolase n=1 Tax=Clostridium cavendishii DSM 21758 TaxID=1121302 RepID=A0A1M6PIU6_9CLOT|nr:Cof-type HAD-IIB family hydrolase [Clostridium cavendishii]SHK07843.1 hypothetical protein SAMN02745163_03169 [Clostridium cavendishii DSM 21758]